MIEKIDWQECSDSGLLWFINRTLHLFGRAIVFDYDENKKLKEVYWAKCNFRGFSEKSETKGFTKVSNYLKENIDELSKECE